MNADIKREWVAALRSGKYKQGTGSLRRELPGGDVQDCCLGVLCDVVKDRVGLDWEDRVGERDLLTSGREVSFGGSYDFTPGVVRKVTGLREVDESDLAGMNDQGSSFADIADHIEGNL